MDFGMAENLKRVASVVVLSFCVFLCSCATTGYQRASHTRSAIQDARAVTLQIQKDINTALQSMQSLSSQETIDLRPSYGSFAGAVASLHIQVDRLAERTRAIERLSNAYVWAWEKGLGLYHGEAIRKRSADRRGAVIGSFDQLDEQLYTVEQLLRPLLVDLEDMRRYLSTDLTAAGVASSLDLAVHIARQAAVATQNLSALDAELTRVSTELSPVGPGTQTAKATK